MKLLYFYWEQKIIYSKDSFENKRKKFISPFYFIANIVFWILSKFISFEQLLIIQIFAKHHDSRDSFSSLYGGNSFLTNRECINGLRWSPDNSAIVYEWRGSE
jgi:hypothetical protein